MNKQELVDRIGFVLNFNDGATDQDFSAARILQALNFSYKDEVTKASQEGTRRYFKTFQQHIWPASQVTFSLPEGLDQRGLIRVTDITNTDPGYPLVFDEKGFCGDVFWLDRNTLQWGTAGPGSARTLRFEFFAVPSDLVENDDTPNLIPEQFHELLIWSTAIWLRMVADEAAPAMWVGRQNELRRDLWKHISRGRPMDDIPQVSNTYPDSEVGFVF